MKTLLITRPREEADSLAQSLREAGFSTCIEPLLSVACLYENKAALATALAERPQLMLVTSRRAVDALARMTAVRDIPLLTVGIATARHAASQGFNAIAAGETAQSLPEYIAEHYAPSRGGLLYLRGEAITVDIAARLAGASFWTKSIVVYRAIAAECLSERLCEEIKRGVIAGALFFSQRTAAIYAELAQAQALAKAHSAMRAIGMSEAVAAALNPLPWHSVHCAARPDREHMLAAALKVFSPRRL